jgi:hypothetical protein
MEDGSDEGEDDDSDMEEGDDESDESEEEMNGGNEDGAAMIKRALKDADNDSDSDIRAS